MADYPAWVLEHKKKGTYINRVKDKYYLYAAHSERIKGTKKVRRVCDGYLGRITQVDGLIPPKDKLNSIPVVYSYGAEILVLSLSHKIYTGFKRSFKQNADFILVSSLLIFLFDRVDSVFFHSSYVSILFPEVDMESAPSKIHETAISRGVLMITDSMQNKLGIAYDKALQYLPLVHIVNADGKFYGPHIPGGVKEFLECHSIELEVPSWLQ